MYSYDLGEEKRGRLPLTMSAKEKKTRVCPQRKSFGGKGKNNKVGYV